ncbi:uncharacterized protein [Nicotiana tomentosiformis]|uniref:uncharacterized protein isoform X3 n=1 Tax=Nicotiana tomentosiformis TaxID=4098 RepID=UPI00051AD053|nr:uncharacterized protein LOC104113862 isoform X3 [Nicotiana tomentosiformis]
MDIESGSPNSNVTFSTHETILPMPQFTPSPEVNSIIRGPADPLVRGEQTKMLLNLEARKMNDALRKAHDSLVHEAEILKDLEIAKASAEVGCGIEIESEPGVGAVEVEGVLISRSVFFGRSNAILDSDPCTGFNRTRHTVEKISYLFMGFLHLCIADSFQKRMHVREMELLLQQSISESVVFCEIL